MNRGKQLEQALAHKGAFDVIVVGGGATGLGAAVEAATRGHTTLLIEQSDFAKGTSSRSTKLVHGGVRYLQQGNVQLVLEALRERGRMHRNAPHLVHNMGFVIPAYAWWQVPFYGIGMKVYDALAGKLGLGPSRMLSRKPKRSTACQPCALTAWPAACSTTTGNSMTHAWRQPGADSSRARRAGTQLREVHRAAEARNGGHRCPGTR
jgi:glycerol-3-phosphate dehydrogenase